MVSCTQCFVHSISDGGMTDFAVSVGNKCPADPEPVYKTCYYQKETLPQGSRLNITCVSHAKGRYVKLQLRHKARLFVSEVEVFANAGGYL